MCWCVCPLSAQIRISFCLSCVCAHISLRVRGNSVHLKLAKIRLSQSDGVSCGLCLYSVRHREIKKKERGGVIRIFLSMAQASDEMVKFLALAPSLNVSAHL